MGEENGYIRNCSTGRLDKARSLIIWIGRVGGGEKEINE